MSGDSTPASGDNPPTAPPARGKVERATVAAVATLLVALWAVRWVLRSRHLYEWDSAQHALGARHFDVTIHNPHPPGYPLFILLLKALHLVLADLNVAMLVIGTAVTVGATAILFRLAERTEGRVVALLAAGALLFSPVVIFTNAVACTYPVDLLTSALLASLSSRMWTGSRRTAPWAGLALALMAGVRESGAVLMAPLVLVAVVRANGRHVRGWLVTALVTVSATLAWYVPTALMNGGFAAFHALNSATAVGYFRARSYLFGASAEAHLAMVTDAAAWAAAAVAVPALLAVSAVMIRLAFRRSADRPVVPAGRLTAPFLLLWIAPNVLYVTLLNCVKPGFLSLGIPPAMLLCARGLAPTVRAIARRVSWRGETVAASAVCVVAAACTGLTLPHYGPRLDRTTFASVRQSDEDARRFIALMRSGPGEQGTLAVYLGCGPFGPNVRWAAAELPALPAAMLFGTGDQVRLREFRDFAFKDDDRARKLVAPEVRRILWVTGSDDPPPPWLRAFPRSRQVLRGITARVYASEIGPGDFDARFSFQGGNFHLGRGGLPPSPCVLGDGFLPPQDRDAPWEPLWGLGPRSTLAVHLEAAAPVRIVLRVDASISPAQEVTLHAPGVETVASPRPGADVVVAFDGVPGDNLVTLEYARWNHHPDEGAPGDPRPFAVAFREVTCDVGGSSTSVFE